MNQAVASEKRRGNAAFRKKRKATSFKKTWPLYLMFVFPFIWFAIFCYVPMVGITRSFMDFVPGSGI
ncbi:MAG: hypothetical protein LBH24_05850, partial [Clostridiales bacterium]|nr:hypothetical protein [Clostridiales bacterium]